MNFRQKDKARDAYIARTQEINRWYYDGLITETERSQLCTQALISFQWRLDNIKANK